MFNAHIKRPPIHDQRVSQQIPRAQCPPLFLCLHVQTHSAHPRALKHPGAARCTDDQRRCLPSAMTSRGGRISGVLRDSEAESAANRERKSDAVLRRGNHFSCASPRGSTRCPQRGERGAAEAFSYTRTYLVERFLRVASARLPMDIPAEAREIQARFWYVLCGWYPTILPDQPIWTGPTTTSLEAGRS